MKEIEELSAVLTRITEHGAAISVTDLLTETGIPAVPLTTPIREMGAIIAGVMRHQPIASQVVPDVPVAAPALVPTRELSTMVAGITRTEPLAACILPEPVSEIPTLVSPGGMGRLLKAILAVSPIEGVLPDEISEVPKVHDTNRLRDLVEGLARHAVSNLPRLPRVPVAPTGLVTISDGLALSKSLEQHRVEQKSLEADLLAETRDIVAAESALSKMVEDAGGICPLCNGMTLGGIHGH